MTAAINKTGVFQWPNKQLESIDFLIGRTCWVLGQLLHWQLTIDFWFEDDFWQISDLTAWDFEQESSVLSDSGFGIVMTTVGHSVNEVR